AVTPLSTKRDGLSPELDTLLSRALALDPGARFGSAAQFRQALEQLAQKLGLNLGAVDFSKHIRIVCGEDTGSWKALDSFALEEPQGTAQMSVDEIEKEMADDRPATRSGVRSLPPLSQPGRELTSVLTKAKRDAAAKQAAQDAARPRRETLPRGGAAGMIP